jgi:hypothetical protein
VPELVGYIIGLFLLIQGIILLVEYYSTEADDTTARTTVLLLKHNPTNQKSIFSLFFFPKKQLAP